MYIDFCAGLHTLPVVAILLEAWEESSSIVCIRFVTKNGMKIIFTLSFCPTHAAKNTTEQSDQRLTVTVTAQLSERHTIQVHACSYTRGSLPSSMFTPLSMRCFWQLSHLVPSVHPRAPHFSPSIAVCVFWEGLGLWSCLTQLNLCDGACWPQCWLWQIALFKSAVTSLSEYKS